MTATMARGTSRPPWLGTLVAASIGGVAVAVYTSFIMRRAVPHFSVFDRWQGFFAVCSELGCQVGRMADELKRAIDELRDLAHGIHPAALTEQGLAVALEALAEASPVPARVRAVPRTRLPPTVEATANAGKHAQATAIDIAAHLDGGRLVVEVADDGSGGADIRGGTGLAGIDDRVAAIVGTLRHESPAGGGTRLRVGLPCG